MAVSNFKNFIPTIWSARLLANLDKNLVFLNMVNRDYEGEISAYGDTVKINQLGDITIKDYTGVDIDAPEELKSTQQTLVIDQAKYFNFAVKDIDKAQANVNLIESSMARAGVAMAGVIDQDVAALVTQAKHKVGAVGTPIQVGKKDAYDFLVDLGVKLDEANISKVGRKIVLPPWFVGLLSKDYRFTRDPKVLQNGVVEGQVVGNFQILESNNVLKAASDPTVYQVMAGTTQAISFANQVVETEAYRPEGNFSDAVKGLNVWGRAVIQPEALANFVIKPLDETTQEAGEEAATPKA